MAMPNRVRLNKPDLFQALGYEPHAGQLEIHRSKARVRTVACGTRWGKSTAGVYEAVAELLAPRDMARGWLVAPTYELTTRIFRHVVSIMQSRFGHRVIEFEEREHRIVIANLGGGRSELRARSADRPDGLLGESLDFLIVDEAAKIREGVWDEFLAPRLVDRHGRALTLSTPDGPSWFYREFRRGQKNRDPDYASFSMPSSTNPHVPAAAIEAERKRLTPDQFRQQYGAEFLGADLYPCDTCGGPSAGMISCLIVLHGAEKPRLCPECRKYVGEDGRTRVWLMNGKPHTQFVVVQSYEFLGIEPPTTMVQRSRLAPA